MPRDFYRFAAALAITVTMHRRRSPETYDRFSAAVDGPMMILALIMIPLLLAPYLWHLSASLSDAFAAADWLIWALFTAEYGIKLALAPDRRRFVRTHIPDLVVIIIPVLRPLRVLRAARLVRIARLTRLAGFVATGIREAKGILSRRGLHFTLLVAVVVIFAAAGAETIIESGAKGSNIHSFGDALWWAVVTVATVGYGDRFPVTSAGRGVAVVLMLAGVAIFGAVTASIAAYLVETDKTPDPQLEEISDRLARIEALLQQEREGQDAI